MRHTFQSFGQSGPIEIKFFRHAKPGFVEFPSTTYIEPGRTLLSFHPMSWKQPLLTWMGSLACDMAWELSGGSLAVPILARIDAAGETYLILDEQESCRASVLLVQVVPPKQMVQRSAE
jgi:hypothetical protein